MGIARLEFDESGEFAIDVFYEIYWENTWTEADWMSDMGEISPQDILSKPRQLTRDRSLVVAEVFHAEERDEHKCSVSKIHRTNTIIDSMVMELRGDLHSDFVPNTRQMIILAGPCARTISQSCLLGFRFVDIIIRETEVPFPREKEGLKLVQTARNNPLRQSRVLPPEANRCHVCGYEPICCLKCGFFFMACPRCEEGTFATVREHKGEGDGRIKLLRSSGPGPIIEVDRWDGSDLVGSRSTQIVTRRVVDLLLAMEVWPFVAWPVRANVQGISKEKGALLERAKRPL